MLIICEGLDKSGKSTLVDMLHKYYVGSILIRKQYKKELYPIDFGKASEYDWQAILDRLVLANPDTMFIADRSFFTQTVYQICLGTGEHAITDEQAKMFNNYCEVVKSIPHLVIYCQSPKYELDSLVTSIAIRSKLDAIYHQSLHDSGLNVISLNTAELSMQEQISIITKKIAGCYTASEQYRKACEHDMQASIGMPQ